MRKPRPAYTLLEMVLVLAVLGILGALALPTLRTMYSDLRAKAAADAVRAAWAEARAHAVNEGRPYRFSLVLDHGNYRVAPDSPEYWGGGDVPAGGGDMTGPAFVLDDALPPGVRFRNPESLQVGAADDTGDTALPPGGVDPGAWTATILFLPDGTVRTEQEIVEVGLEAPNTRPLVVRLRSLTGVITVRTYRAEGRP